MPGGREYRDMQELLGRESIRELREIPDVVEAMLEPDGLMRMIERQMPDLDPVEKAWLEQIPQAQREAIRSVVAHVGSMEDLEMTIDLQYEPQAYYSLTVYEFSDTIVLRIGGPIPEGLARPGSA